MAGISCVNVKLAGSHAGISIGEDGPSQMALEDLSMMRVVPDCAVLYPCDAVSTERLVAAMAQHTGLAYMRTSRPKTPVIYDPDEAVPNRRVEDRCDRADDDVATVVGVGVTVFEALKAYDQLFARGYPHPRHRCLLPAADRRGDARARPAKATKGRIMTVEDHYPSGGLGDAVERGRGSAGFAVRRLAVREIPRSGQPEELLDRYGISARHIVEAVKKLLSSRRLPTETADCGLSGTRLVPPRRQIQRVEQHRERRVRLCAMLRPQPEQHDAAGIHVDRDHGRAAGHQLFALAASRTRRRRSFG